MKNAVDTLAALAQITRLSVFRLLVKAGPSGVPAGEIAGSIGVAPATLSFHLKELEHAGLVSSRRESRQIFYVSDFEGMQALLAFLYEDCCQGRSEFCVPFTQDTRAVRGASRSS